MTHLQELPGAELQKEQTCLVTGKRKGVEEGGGRGGWDFMGSWLPYSQNYETLCKGLQHLDVEK